MTASSDPNDIGEFFAKQQEKSERQNFYIAMENAKNLMRRVRILIQEGDYDEAIEEIDEALGDKEA